MNPFQIVKGVRITLTRLRLDTATVVAVFERGTLHVSGQAQRMFGFDERRPQLNRELLHELDRRLRHIEGVRQVEYNLNNWALNSDGHWTPKKER